MSTICLNGTVSATFNAGSGGLSCSDSYEYSVNGGINWAAYTPGSNITATNLGTNVVQVRGYRNCTGDGCDNDGPVILAYWTVVANPDAATLTRLRSEFEAMHERFRTGAGLLVRRPYVVTVGNRRV